MSDLSNKTTAELEEELEKRKAKNIDTSLNELLKKEKDTLERLRSEAKYLDEGIEVVFPLCQFNLKCVASWSWDNCCGDDDMRIELDCVTTTGSEDKQGNSFLQDIIEESLGGTNIEEFEIEIPAAKKIVAPFRKRVKSFVNECTRLCRKYNVDQDDFMHFLNRWH